MTEMEKQAYLLGKVCSLKVGFFFVTELCSFSFDSQRGKRRGK